MAVAAGGLNAHKEKTNLVMTDAKLSVYLCTVYKNPQAAQSTQLKHDATLVNVECGSEQRSQRNQRNLFTSILVAAQKVLIYPGLALPCISWFCCCCCWTHPLSSTAVAATPAVMPSNARCTLDASSAAAFSIWRVADALIRQTRLLLFNPEHCDARVKPKR
jgi:hypothetical protein